MTPRDAEKITPTATFPAVSAPLGNPQPPVEGAPEGRKTPVVVREIDQAADADLPQHPRYRVIRHPEHGLALEEEINGHVSVVDYFEGPGAILDWCDELEESVRLQRAAVERFVASNRPRPRVVCLCGSTRFADAWVTAQREEGLAGRIALSVASLVHQPGQDVTPDQKVALDELHRRKIDLADEVLVLNVGGYIGESTRGEISYATAHGKPIRYLEPLGASHG